MERETGCKIAIRGKGSVKEGRQGRRDGRSNPDEDDELHVLITGPTGEAVQAGKQLVEELLRPVDDNMNVHKQKQLRELALINGTLRDENFCNICGEPGHRQYECPSKQKVRGERRKRGWKRRRSEENCWGIEENRRGQKRTERKRDEEVER